MKIGCVYEDSDTGKLWKCVNFTRSYYCFEDSNGKYMEVEKTLDRGFLRFKNRVTSKKRLNEFDCENDFKYEIGQEVSWVTVPGMIYKITGRKADKLYGNCYSLDRTTGWIYETSLNPINA